MDKLAFKVVIPARYGSSRLPGKPLVALAGEPMVVHVLRRAQEAEPDAVVVATDDPRIVEVVRAAGGTAVLTSPDHPTGTDRLAEVADKLGFASDDIVVNLQGDEPLMDPRLVRGVAAALSQHRDAHLATLAVPITDPAEIFSPHCVKVVLDHNGRALYFSRAPIPWLRGEFEPAVPCSTLPSAPRYLRHLGLYAYRARTLRTLTTLKPTSLEQAESLEQLRALEHGMHIQVLVHEGPPPPPGVDTPADVQAASEALARRATRGPKA
jgi:3-deoxy-manno-octulosonate cytidylyltransferase (CMP-KDO synthetase)